jgi:hypothetical protein
MEKELINDLIKAGYTGEFTVEAIMLSFNNTVKLTVEVWSGIKWTAFCTDKAYNTFIQSADNALVAVALLWIDYTTNGIKDGFYGIE